MWLSLDENKQSDGEEPPSDAVSFIHRHEKFNGPWGLNRITLILSKMVDRTWVSPGQYRRSDSTAISNPANRPRTSMKGEVYSSSNRR